MRFFIEVSYAGVHYGGSQSQKNASSIQSVLEEKLHIFLKGNRPRLVGASRTDAGVHARQNFYHIDTNIDLAIAISLRSLNAILPKDIAVARIVRVKDDAHCRYDAISRRYEYIITRSKNPFLQGYAYYYPSPLLHYATLDAASAHIKRQNNFLSFSKKHTQVHNFICAIEECAWLYTEEENRLVFSITANRFLRGMVRALVATQLKTASDKLSMDDFKALFLRPEIASAYFSAPAEGLYLQRIKYPSDIFYDH